MAGLSSLTSSAMRHWRSNSLLRQLVENGTVRRVGDRRERPVDVRFIAATNAPLEELASAGSFRRDLLDRFGFFRIQMPALVEARAQLRAGRSLAQTLEAGRGVVPALVTGSTAP